MGSGLGATSPEPLCGFVRICIYIYIDIYVSLPGHAGGACRLSKEREWLRSDGPWPNCFPSGQAGAFSFCAKASSGLCAQSRWIQLIASLRKFVFVVSQRSENGLELQVPVPILLNRCPSRRFSLSCKSFLLYQDAVQHLRRRRRREEATPHIYG